MTITVTFLDDQTKQPAVYLDRADLDTYTLQIATDVTASVDVGSVRIRFPVKIFGVDAVKNVTVTSPGWKPPVAAGPYLTLTPTGSVALSSTAPLMIQLAGVKSGSDAATNDDLQVFVADEAPTTKIFLMRFPGTARDLSQVMLPDILPTQIYRTPTGHGRIENVISLRLTNSSPNTALVTDPWTRTPSIRLSFVYGDDIGSLTPADPPISDPNSAFNIAIDAAATYKDGEQTYEWTATAPDSGATDTSPVWLLQPVPENIAVLGSGSGATVEFRISGMSTAAPSGSTQIYLQYSDFPGYNDGFITLPLSKAEPVPSIVYFDGVPNYVALLGDPVTLKWQTIAMDRVELQVAGQPVNDPLDTAHGSHTVSIDRNTPFSLLAYDKSGDTAPAHIAQWTGHVPDAEIVVFSADKSQTADGSPVVVSWSLRAVRSAEIRSDTTFEIAKSSLANGSRTYYPRRTTTYTLHVTGEGDPADRSVGVFVLERGWAARRMGLDPAAGEGPVLYGTDAGLILLGGQSDNAIFQSADAEQWDQVGVAAFSARNDAAGCTLGGKLWIMGGLSGGQPCNDVWNSDDGLTWIQVNAAAPWPARSRFACAAFNGKLWIFGGVDQNLQPLADIWSSGDGVAWNKAPDEGRRWAARSGLAVAQFQEKLWLFGGLLADGTVSADLWVSDDGATWTIVRSEDMFASVAARQQAALGVIGSSLYLFGGIDAQGNPLNDLNVFDEGDWDLGTGPANWAISRPGFTVWRDAFWFAGGRDGNADSDAVWSWYPS